MDPQDRRRSTTKSSFDIGFQTNNSNISIPRATYTSRGSVSSIPRLPNRSSTSINNLKSLDSDSTPSPIISARTPSDVPDGLNDIPYDLDDDDRHDGFVEFDLSGPGGTRQNTVSKSASVVSFTKEHHIITETKKPEESKLHEHFQADENDDDDRDSFDFDSGDWKDMAAVTETDYYNDRGDLEFGLENSEDDNGKNKSSSLNGGPKGYTRINAEAEAAKYSKLDAKTEFLFRDEKENSVAYHDKDKQDAIAEEDSDFDDEYNYHSDTENINPTKKLQAMKSMLKESQKFAYVGITKLITVDMATDLAKVKLSTSNKIAKQLSSSQKNFSNWTLYVMSKLYDHMDLSEEEKSMIEKLSIHGINVTDLSKSLNKTETVDNPMYDKEAAEKKISESENTDGVGSQEEEMKEVETEDNSKKVLRPEDIETQSQITIDLKWTVICDLFLILLSDGYYDARSRSLLVAFAKYLNIDEVEIFLFERRITDNLEIDTQSKSIENKDENYDNAEFIARRAKKDKRRKLAYIGLATLGGGLVIGLSAGLLAPVIGAGIAAGLTTVGITGTAGFLAGVGGTAIVTTTGVVAGARIGSRGMAKRVGSVKTFEFRPLHNNKRTNLIITVSGWINGKADDIRLPFSTVDPVMGDLFSLLWEPDMLLSMGQTINILATEALTSSIQQILGATVLTALMASIQLPMALSKLGYLLDNPWNVSLDRAWSAGKILADSLISGTMGVRPITLVGFSLGARLIYSCLIELANRGAFGLIENVIIFGTPITVKNDQLALARTVVSGRFVNGYSKKDWVLGYLFRATAGGLSTVAGLTELEKIHGIENFDCTDYVTGHMEYRKAMPQLLAKLDWEVLSEEFVEIDEPDPEQSERTRKLVHEFDEARQKMNQEQLNRTKSNRKSWKNWFKPKKKEWWEIYEEGSKQTELHKQESEQKPSEDKPSGTEEYKEEEYEVDDEETRAIFDVNALLEEVQGIEKLTADSNNLEKMRNVKETPISPQLHMNEDDELSTSMMENQEGDETSAEPRDTKEVTDIGEDEGYDLGFRNEIEKDQDVERNPNNSKEEIHMSFGDEPITMSFGNEFDHSQPVEMEFEDVSEKLTNDIEMSFPSEMETPIQMSFGDDLDAPIQMSFGEDVVDSSKTDQNSPVISSMGQLTKPSSFYS